MDMMQNSPEISAPVLRRRSREGLSRFLKEESKLEMLSAWSLCVGEGGLSFIYFYIYLDKLLEDEWRPVNEAGL